MLSTQLQHPCIIYKSLIQMFISSLQLQQEMSSVKLTQQEENINSCPDKSWPLAFKLYHISQDIKKWCDNGAGRLRLCPCVTRYLITLCTILISLTIIVRVSFPTGADCLPCPCVGAGVGGEMVTKACNYISCQVSASGRPGAGPGY